MVRQLLISLQDNMAIFLFFSDFSDFPIKSKDCASPAIMRYASTGYVYAVRRDGPQTLDILRCCRWGARSSSRALLAQRSSQGDFAVTYA